MATIDQFKAQLIGGGPRANRFRVFVPRTGNKIEFLCKATSIPAATITPVEVPFRGQVLKLAGDRTFEDWSITVINDNEFSARTALEAWQEEIQGFGTSDGATSTDKSLFPATNQYVSIQQFIHSGLVGFSLFYIAVEHAA